MKLFSVKMTFLHPVELNGYLEGEDEAEVRKQIAEKGKEQGHLDVKIIELYEVDYPKEGLQKPEAPVLN